MSLTKGQKAMLHVVPAVLGLDEDQRKLIQMNIGGAWSAVDMTFEGFCRVMSFYEERGWIDERNGRNYWAAQRDGARRTALRGKALKLAALAGWTVQGRPQGRNVDFGRVDAFVRTQFGGTRARLMDCDEGQLGELIEALKDIARRAGANVWSGSGAQFSPRSKHPTRPARAKRSEAWRRGEGEVA